MAGVDHGTLYHLIQKTIWDECKANGSSYFPPTYEQDGFIHLTKEPHLLLWVANHFYTSVPGTFLVLALDSTKLTSKVIFEPAAPVGSTEAFAKGEQQLFPHLFGTIDFESVVAELSVSRDPDGRFLTVQALTDAEAGGADADVDEAASPPQQLARIHSISGMRFVDPPPFPPGAELSSGQRGGARTLLLIDTDPGVDDAMAILGAFNSSDEVEVVGLTTLFGNVSAAQATANALSLLDMAGAQHVPVVQGADRSSHMIEPRIAGFVHGTNGFGDVDVPPPQGRAAEGQSAAEFIVQLVHQHPGEVVILALASLTNVAAALKLDPTISSAWKELVVLGGAFLTSGNVSPAAEANFYGDPAAADFVLGAGGAIKVVGLDVTHQCVLTSQQLAALEGQGRFGSFLSQISQFYLRFHKAVYDMDGIYLHDPTALAAVLRPELFTWRHGAVRVLSEGIAMGHSLMDDTGRVYVGENAWRPGRPPVLVAVGVDGPAVVQLVQEAITR